ncbi:MAG: 2-amino-4-hydroxy-6-hydroxymethyldihydropteridine diphosphokinase [Methylomonas sp.]
MTTGYISIGSNIDKEIHIPSSLKALRELFGDLVISSIYETEPVGFVGDKFYNLVVGFESALTAKEVAKLLRQIELDHGRSRDSHKFSARTLDLDLILYGEQVISDGRLQIPRDEIERYAFVLEPLAEIAAEKTHPLTGKSYGKLWQNFDKSDLQQTKVLPDWLSDK